MSNMTCWPKAKSSTLLKICWCCTTLARLAELSMALQKSDLAQGTWAMKSYKRNASAQKQRAQAKEIESCRYCTIAQLGNVLTVVQRQL